MPDGSSSAAPVIKPGPSLRKNLGRKSPFGDGVICFNARKYSQVKVRAFFSIYIGCELSNLVIRCVKRCAMSQSIRLDFLFGGSIRNGDSRIFYAGHTAPLELLRGTTHCGQIVSLTFSIPLLFIFPESSVAACDPDKFTRVRGPAPLAFEQPSTRSIENIQPGASSPFALFLYDSSKQYQRGH